METPTQSKGTPGPWRSVELGSEGSRIYPDVEDKRERMKFIAVVCGRDTLTDFANGKIIATAPMGVELARMVDTEFAWTASECKKAKELARSILAQADGTV